MKHLTKLAACILATVIVTTGCSTFFKRTPANMAALPKHYVMTLHGVRGNEQSYGQFHELIKTHLEKVDPNYEVIPLNYTYKTAQLDYTPHKAAQEINARLDKDIPVLRPEDKISVVAYSMGGQVGVAWYYDSLRDPAHSKYPLQTVNFVSLGAAFWGAQEAGLFTNDVELMKRTLKGVIKEVNLESQRLTVKYLNQWAANKLASRQDNINTRYLFPQINKLQSIRDIKEFYDKKTIKSMYEDSAWGDWAGSALDLSGTLKSIRNSSLRDLAKISFAELEALSIAGPTVTELRTSMMGAPKNTRTKWTSISTLVQCFENDLGSEEAGCNNFQNKAFEQMNQAFVKYQFGAVRRETDNAVITPSSIAQFHYAFDYDTNYADGDLIPASAFRLSINPENHKAIFAETLHATLVTEGIYNKALSALGKLGKSWTRLADDVVIVHKDKCMTPEKCDHPVYRYIVDELSDCNEPNSRCDMSEYRDVVGKFLHRSSKDEPIAQIQNTLKSELHGFSLELNLRLPKGYNTKNITESNIFETAVKVDFEQNDNEDRILRTQTGPYKVHLGRKMEVGSILIKTVPYSDQTHFKVNFTGLITTDKNTDYNHNQLQNGLPVRFKVSLPGLKSRQIEAVVSPYHSTFVDVTLAK
jgi:Putative serine esterase (DUF676)